MRRLLALPLLAVALSAQRAPELVVSVGHAATPSHAAFVGTYLATASSSNVALIELSSGITIAHLAHRSLVTVTRGESQQRSSRGWHLRSLHRPVGREVADSAAPHRADPGVRGISFVQPGWSFSGDWCLRVLFGWRVADLGRSQGHPGTRDRQRNRNSRRCFQQGRPMADRYRRQEQGSRIRMAVRPRTSDLRRSRRRCWSVRVCDPVES